MVNKNSKLSTLYDKIIMVIINMKKIYWIIFVAVIVILEIGIVTKSYMSDTKNDIPSNYIAIFKGETSSVVHTTYLYKDKKGNTIEYKYINTISTLEGYDSGEWHEKVTKKGTIKKKNKIYEIAEKNEAYTYAKFSNDDQIYSVEEFKKLFK